MARKKATTAKPQPLEQQPLFLEVLDALPSDAAALEQLATAARELFNDAIRSNAPEQMEVALLRYKAAIYRLNGDTWFGCRAPGGVEQRLWDALAAPAGSVPGWGQAGEWLLEVDGMRLRATIDPWSLGIHSLGLYAVDANAPFLSETGFRACFIHPEQWLGHDLGAVVRAEVAGMLQSKEGWPKPINEKDRAQVKVPAWLAPALASVTRNGQLAMPLHGEALPAAEPKAPLSNKERQKLFRQRERERKAALKAEGVRVVELSETDRAYLYIALDTHIAFKEPLDWQLQYLREFAGRLFKGDEHAEAKVQLLGTSEGVANLQKQRDKNAKLGWDSYHKERERSSDLIERCSAQAQELARARAEVQRLQAALQQIAAEVGAAPSASATLPAPVASVDRVEALQRQVKNLEASNALEVADRAKALEAVEVLQARLQRAGLPHDYRRQPGE